MALKTNAKSYAAFNVYCQAGFTTIMPRNVKQSKDYLNNSMVVKPHFKNFTIFFMVFTIPFYFLQTMYKHGLLFHCITKFAKSLVLR